jgi:predicted NUDIX family NTP pyrophosphohydrolase
MTIHSAGILLFRQAPRGGSDGAESPSIEVLLAHPGGPFFARKDAGVWSLPKGVYDPGDEDALAAARREFAEETGGELPNDPPVDLGWIEQRSGKVVQAFAYRGDFDAESLASNDFEMEWPPHSGRVQRFPEVDRAAWFTPVEARTKLLPAQAVFIDRLLEALADAAVSEPGSSAEA